jgi:hypothetical protein
VHEGLPDVLDARHDSSHFLHLQDFDEETEVVRIEAAEQNVEERVETGVSLLDVDHAEVVSGVEPCHHEINNLEQPGSELGKVANRPKPVVEEVTQALRKVDLEHFCQDAFMQIDLLGLVEDHVGKLQF